MNPKLKVVTNTNQDTDSLFVDPGIRRPVIRDLFTGQPTPLRIDYTAQDEFPEEPVALEEGLKISSSPEGWHIVISGYGYFLGKKRERLIIRKAGKTKIIREFPLLRVGCIQIDSKGVSVSSDLIAELCERGIRLSFTNRARGSLCNGSVSPPQRHS